MAALTAIPRNMGPACVELLAADGVGTRSSRPLVASTRKKASISDRSAAVHYHEELDENRPFYVFSDFDELIGGYDLLRARASAPDTWVVSGHDPLEMERFERVNDHCVDLTNPTAATDPERGRA